MRHIFVSSTFRDMQAERDMLHLEVLPHLNALGLDYGERVGVVDLRWGVNTGDLDTESSSKKVLSVCLDEIDRCQPYMIIFLGERYGWIPDGRLMEHAAREKAFTLDEMSQSVTALEIEYGALSRTDALERCIFCVRQPLPLDRIPASLRDSFAPESPAHQARLDALKSRIRELPGLQVITYQADWDEDAAKVCGLEPLAAALKQRLLQLLLPSWKAQQKSSWQEQELAAFRLFVEEKSSHFMGRQDLLARYGAIIRSAQTQVFVLKGQAGSGKSSMVSTLAKVLEQDGHAVFPFICGNSAHSGTVDEMVQQMVWFLEAEMSLDHFENETRARELTVITREQWRERFCQLVLAYGKAGRAPLVLIADALDQLREEEIITNLGWLPHHIPENVTFVLSCLDHLQLRLHDLSGMAREHFAEEQLEPLQGVEREEIIHGILRANHKGLDGRVIAALLSKRGASNPLYLSMLLQRLQIMDSDDFRAADALGTGGEALDLQMIQLIEEAPEDLPGMSAALIAEACERCNQELCREALTLLSVSRYGLRTDDLEQIFQHRGLPWSALDFARLTKYMQPYFTVRRDGRINFAHRAIREGLLAGEPDLSLRHKLIAARLNELPITDPLRFGEGLYHLHILDEKQLVISHLLLVIAAGDDRLHAATAKELKTICVADGGVWLADLLQRVSALDGGNVLLLTALIAESLHQELLSMDELKIGAFLLKQCVDLLTDCFHTLRQACLDNSTDQDARSLAQRSFLTAAWCKKYLADTWREHGVLEESLQLYRNALDFCQTEDISALCGSDDRAVLQDRRLLAAELSMALGSILTIEGSDYEAAFGQLARARESILGLMKTPGYDPESELHHRHRIAFCQEEQARILVDLGDWDQAKAAFADSLQIERDIHDQCGGSYLSLCHLRDSQLKHANLAVASEPMVALAECDGAVQFARQALEQADIPKNRNAFSRAVLLRGRCLLALGNLADAHSLLQEAYLVCEVDQQGQSVEQAFLAMEILTVMGHCLAAQGESEQAMQIYANQLALCKHFLDQGIWVHGFLASAVELSWRMSLLLAQAGKLAEAINRCVAGISCWMNAGSPSYPVQRLHQVLIAYQTMAELVASRNPGQAQRICAQAIGFWEGANAAGHPKEIERTVDWLRKTMQQLSVGEAE